MTQSKTTSARELSLIIRVGPQLYALPLGYVAETMRPQPVRTISGGRSFVRGVAVIRGVPVPVVDAASVLDDDVAASASTPTRFVLLNVADRHVALAVDAVIGVRQIDRTHLSELPPLLAAANEQIVSAIGILDSELVIVLRSGKLVPDDLWAAIEAEIRS